MARDFTATLDETSERAADWQAAYGSLTVPIKTPVPVLCDLPVVGRQPCYFLDVAELLPEQRAHLEMYLATHFGVPLAEAQALILAGEDVPLLAEGCTVTIYNPQRWL